MILTLFESVQRAYTRQNQVVSGDWAEIASFLSTHVPASTKDEVELFNLWEFDMAGEPGRKKIYVNGEWQGGYELLQGTVRRCKANAIQLHGLVLDVDEHLTIDACIEKYQAFEFLLYTTFRNTPEKNKFRIVFPFEKPVEQATLRLKEQSIRDTFAGADNASFSESQAFYLHSGAEPRVHYNSGLFLNANWFEDRLPEILPERIPTEFTGDRGAYKERLVESLLTCSGLHYASTQSKLGVLTLVALCKSADLTFEEFNAICWQMAAPDSTLKDAQVRKSAWQSWQPHTGITARVREEFISAYGGTSQFVKVESMGRLVNKDPEQARRVLRERYARFVKKDDNKNG